MLFCVLHKQKILLEIFFSTTTQKTQKKRCRKKKKKILKNPKNTRSMPDQTKKNKKHSNSPTNKKTSSHLSLDKRSREKHEDGSDGEARKSAGSDMRERGFGKTTLLRHVRDDVDVSTSSTTSSTSTTTTTSTATKTMRQHQHNLSVVVENVERTIGCSTEVKLIFHEHARTEHFVELWDVGGHDQFKDDRAAFFRDINAVILVHDASQKTVR